MPDLSPATPFSVDTSSYGATARPTNPFGIMQDAAQLQAQMNQNMLFQQQFAARRAMGEIVQKNIDPETGQPNWNRAGIEMSMDPRTAYMAPDFLKSLMDRQLLEKQVFAAEVANTQNVMTMVGNAFTPLVQEMQANGGLLPPDPNDPSKADLSKLIDQAGLIAGQNPEMRQMILDRLVQLKMAPRSEASAMVTNWAKSALIAKSGLDGVSTSLDLKGVTPEGVPYDQKGRVDRVTGEFKPYDLSPKGASVVETPSGTMSEGGSGGASAPKASLPPLPQGSIATGLEPVTAATLKDIGEKYVPELNDRVRDANQLLAMMSQVRDELKDFTPGGAEELRIELASFANAMGMPKEIQDSIANGDLSSAQAARKLFFGIGSQMAAQLVRAGGGRMTQTEWAATLMRGAPNVNLTEEAIGKIFSAMKELAHYTQLEQKAFNDYRASGSDLTQWQNEWTKVFNMLIERREKRRQK